jgi:hypothetical protein
VGEGSKRETDADQASQGGAEAAARGSASAGEAVSLVPSVVASLVAEWEDETRFMSSSTEMMRVPAFASLVALGEEALPILVNHVRRNPHLSLVLHAITGANPVPKEDAGRMAKVADAWIAWWERVPK